MRNSSCNRISEFQDFSIPALLGSTCSRASCQIRKSSNRSAKFITFLLSHFYTFPPSTVWLAEILQFFSISGFQHLDLSVVKRSSDRWKLTRRRSNALYRPNASPPSRCNNRYIINSGSRQGVAVQSGGTMPPRCRAGSAIQRRQEKTVSFPARASAIPCAIRSAPGRPSIETVEDIG